MNFRSEIKDGQYVFDIPTIANSIGLQAADLSNHLQSLKVLQLVSSLILALFWIVIVLLFQASHLHLYIKLHICVCAQIN